MFTPSGPTVRPPVPFAHRRRGLAGPIHRPSHPRLRDEVLITQHDVDVAIEIHIRKGGRPGLLLTAELGFCLKRITHFEKRETMKICVAGVDHLDSMFSHEDGDVQVRDEITGELWNFVDGLATDIVV